jgi:uncharacterized membrane protein
MALVGRLHPLLVHFPIALVIAAAAAESAAMLTGSGRWRTLAAANVTAGAAFALAATLAGWRLALDPAMDAPALLEWHRWLGAIGAGATLVAAVSLAGAGRSPAGLWGYRVALFAATALVAAAGHLGGRMVWGAEFLRP